MQRETNIDIYQDSKLNFLNIRDKPVAINIKTTSTNIPSLDLKIFLISFIVKLSPKLPQNLFLLQDLFFL